MEYLSNGLELQIKMAQGAKPGDWGVAFPSARAGGQLHMVSCKWNLREVEAIEAGCWLWMFVVSTTRHL